MSAEWAVPSQTLCPRAGCGLHTPGQIWPCLGWNRRPDAAPSEPGYRWGTRLGDIAQGHSSRTQLGHVWIMRPSGLRESFSGKALFCTRAGVLTNSVKGLLSIFTKKRSCLKQKYHNNYSIYVLPTTQNELQQTVLQKCTQMVLTQELKLAMCVVAPNFRGRRSTPRFSPHSCDNAKQLRAATKTAPIS